MLIFDYSRSGRTATAQLPAVGGSLDDLPAALRRKVGPALPEVSELDAVRHYTRLSQKNFSIDTQFYPLGSWQGFLASMFELQEILKDVTGMAGVSMAPMAGAHGEFAGVAMIRAYHDARGDTARKEIIVPDAAHGTNPATATMCGYTVREIPTDATGSVDLAALKAAVGPHTAGLMLTNPSTLGVFEKAIADIQRIVHDAGGLLYYDGANLNAILGKVRSTPHGGGGPGAGPVGVAERLLPFMPIPLVLNENGFYRLATEADLPQSIGRLSANMGNAGVLMRAYVYARLLGGTGMQRVAEYATLNANYLMVKLREAGFDLAFPTRRASHEFIVTLKKLKDATGVSAMDFAKRLLDYGYHAPTTYFPMLVPECLLIEPTETESRETLDGFIETMKTIKHEAETTPDQVKGAPYSLPVRRLDDVKAARELDLAYQPGRFSGT